MNVVRSPFSPQQNGFLFVNHFRLSLPIRYRLPLLGELDLNDVAYGLCGGMCYAALDYFYVAQARPLDRQVEDLDPRLFTYLRDRQLDSLSVSTVLKLIDWMLRPQAALAVSVKRYELPKLRRRLDRGEPVVLALIRSRGLASPTQNHQVIATGYALDAAAQTATIFLYDPNHPGQEPTLEVHLGRGGGDGPLVTQSTGEPLRAFFLLPYRPQRHVPDLTPVAFAAPPARRAAADDGFRLQWPVDSRRITQAFGENPELYRAFKLPGHEGLDLLAESGAAVYAAAAGVVYQANFPPDHPYGRQIRLKHQVGGHTYHTVYGHLAAISVQVGQTVAAGEVIGQADNTGNSWGAHLHLTLKRDGAQTPGYPAGIIDPQPYLLAPAPAWADAPAVEPGAPPWADAPAVEPPPLPFSGLIVFTTAEAILRDRADPAGKELLRLPGGEYLQALGAAAAVTAALGAPGQWIAVQTAGNRFGYLDGATVQSLETAFPPSDLVVYPFESVNLRAGPSTGFELLATLPFDAPLTVLGDAGIARAKLGRPDSWLQVQTADGLRGFVAAWLVHLTGQVAAPSGIVVYPLGDGVNVRARPSLEANILTVAAAGDALAVLGDAAAERPKIGAAEMWLNVRTPQGFVGYVAAWLVAAAPPAPAPAPADAPASVTLYAAADLNLRAQPAVNSPRVGGLFFNEPFRLLSANSAADLALVGQSDRWLYGQAPNGRRGWAAAWFLQRQPAAKAPPQAAPPQEAPPKEAPPQEAVHA